MSKDISDDEKTLLLNYLKKGGKVFIILGDSEDETPNLDEVLKEYGMQEADGYIADMQRSYQGNYYYIFPEITATDQCTWSDYNRSGKRYDHNNGIYADIR